MRCAIDLLMFTPTVHADCITVTLRFPDNKAIVGVMLKTRITKRSVKMRWTSTDENYRGRICVKRKNKGEKTTEAKLGKENEYTNVCSDKKGETAEE
jgi:hypothetical protein